MLKGTVKKWETINPWHFVWMGVIASELLTTFLSVVISYTLWGGISNQVLIVGFFDAFLVSFIVIVIIIYFVERTSALSEMNERLQIEINERKRSEEKLKASEERLKAFFENARDGILAGC
jgi:PAS domain-containing protein